MTNELNREAFRLSRIYAAGWNAALKDWTLHGAAGKPKNPHASEPEKTRWEEGFVNARKGRKGA